MNARLFACAIFAIGATRIADAQQTPPVHLVGAIVAKTMEPMRTLRGVRVLRDGHVVANDNLGRRLLLFDSTLATFTEIISSTGSTSRIYESNPTTTLLAGMGDSTYFFDPTATALVVIDPRGKVTRVISTPFPPDAGYIGRWFSQFDSHGRLIYRASISPVARPTAAGTYQPVASDSAPIVRAGFGAAEPDTLAYVRLPKALAKQQVTLADGAKINRYTDDPIQVTDDWTVTSDGTVAILRGQDFHIDWVTPDGVRSASPKLPFNWHRLSDSEKVVIVDSVKTYNEAHPEAYHALVGGREVTGTDTDDVIAPGDLADYRAPFRSGTTLADAEGNVWILPTPEVPLSPTPGPVYDVVNRAGKLIDRVQLIPGFGIVGFSPGYIFMTVREGGTTVLVKAKIR